MDATDIQVYSCAYLSFSQGVNYVAAIKATL